MSKDLNLVVLIGRLVRDPEIRYTPNGTPVARFSIANGEKFKQNNEWKDHTNFFDVVVWGNQAVSCEKYLKKGSQISVEGVLRQSRWNDQASNQPRSRIEIVANSVQFLTPSGGGQQTSGNFQGAMSQSESQNYERPAAPRQQSPQPQKQNYQQSNDFIPDPWGDTNFNSSSEESSSGNYDVNDDDIPF